jgi:hypothetical protein
MLSSHVFATIHPRPTCSARSFRALGSLCHKPLPLVGPGFLSSLPPYVIPCVFLLFLFIRLRTLSFSVSCKSCICHSYENTGGVYQLFPFWNSEVRTLYLSLFTFFRTAHPAKDAHPERVRHGGRVEGFFSVVFSLLQFPLLPFVSHSSALFCAQQKLNSFIFRRFRTLSQKYPGWGGGGLIFPTIKSAFSSSRSPCSLPLTPTPSQHRIARAVSHLELTRRAIA